MTSIENQTIATTPDAAAQNFRKFVNANMDYIMKIFGRFQTDNDISRRGSQQDLLEDEKPIPIQSQEDDLRRKYLNEPSAKPIPIGQEILDGHPKQTTFLSYLRDMFKNENHRLERDGDGYVKKLYSERDDSSPKSDEITKLMAYVKEFFGAKPKLFEENFGDTIQNLLAKVIAHHGNDMDDAGSESGDTKGLMKATPIISKSEQLELDEESNSIKTTGGNEAVFEKLLTKIVAQHGSEWFQDLDERGDTNLEEAEGFLQQLLVEKRKENSPAGEEGDGLPEAKLKVLSYLTDLLDTKLNNPQNEVKTEEERQDNLMGEKSEKLEDNEELGAKNDSEKDEDRVVLADEQVELRQTTNEYDTKIRAYLDGLFKSKSESDLPLARKITDKSSPFPEESEEIVSVATNFEEEAGNQVSSRIAENVIGPETCDVCESPECDEVSKTQADEIPPPIGLISCAVDVAKIFSKKRNYPPDEVQAMEEEEPIEGDELGEGDDEAEEDLFEEALDQYSDEEYNLINPINQKPLGIDVLPSHKQGSILHKIYNSGYKYILPQSIQETSLLHQCRRFLSSPNITATNFTWVDQAKDTAVNESMKNEDVFEDARDFLSEKANEGPHSYKSEGFLRPDAQKKTEIRFLVRGADSSQIIVLGKNEEENSTIQDAAVTEDADGHSLTIFAPEIPGPLKLGRIYGAVQDAKLGVQESSHNQLMTKDNFGEPHEINLNSTSAPNVLHDALFHLEERLGGKSMPKRGVKGEIRFLPLETNGDSQDVGGGGVQGNTRSDLVSGKNEPEVEEITVADKIEAHELRSGLENNEMNITQKMLNKN